MKTNVNFRVTAADDLWDNKYSIIRDDQGEDAWDVAKYIYFCNGWKVKPMYGWSTPPSIFFTSS